MKDIVTVPGGHRIFVPFVDLASFICRFDVGKNNVYVFNFKVLDVDDEGVTFWIDILEY